jgi:F0F1-type ATP synthase assembly protein I
MSIFKHLRECYTAKKMSTSSNKQDTPTTPPDQSTVILLLGTIADTTWRMFVPTLGGVGIGLWIDHMMDTAPWYGLAGLAIGIVITTVLMKKQFQKLKEES